MKVILGASGRLRLQASAQSTEALMTHTHTQMLGYPVCLVNLGLVVGISPPLVFLFFAQHH